MPLLRIWIIAALLLLGWGDAGQARIPHGAASTTLVFPSVPATLQVIQRGRP